MKTSGLNMALFGAISALSIGMQGSLFAAEPSHNMIEEHNFHNIQQHNIEAPVDSSYQKEMDAAVNITPTEKEFISQLNKEGRRLYQNLSREGKQLALRLAKQYVDKNYAVREAANVMRRQDEGEESTNNRRRRLSRFR